MLDQMLVGQTPIRYNTHMNRLYLDMDADQVNAGEYIIIECYRKIDPNDFTDISVHMDYNGHGRFTSSYKK